MPKMKELELKILLVNTLLIRLVFTFEWTVIKVVGYAWKFVKYVFEFNMLNMIVYGKFEICNN